MNRLFPSHDRVYVSPVSSIDYNDENLVVEDYPSTILEKGEYLFLITNDIRYLETTYSLSVNINVIDWRFVSESVDDSLEFGAVTATATSSLDFGSI